MRRAPHLHPFPKRESQKINRQKEENFRRRKVTVNTPQITTIPPQIHHKKTTFYRPFSPKPPAKTQKPPTRKKLESAKHLCIQLNPNFIA
jgi:hypothetical protein